MLSTDSVYSDKVKLFLSKKLQESEIKINKIKKSRRILKGLYGTSVVVSVILSTGVTAVTTLFGLPLIPTIIITIFSSTSAITTTLSTKFNLKGKKEKLSVMIENLNRIRNKLDYVLSCNGNLTEAEYVTILKEFTQ
jgi:hypothetical protein